MHRPLFDSEGAGCYLKIRILFLWTLQEIRSAGEWAAALRLGLAYLVLALRRAAGSSTRCWHYDGGGLSAIEHGAVHKLLRSVERAASPGTTVWSGHGVARGVWTLRSPSPTYKSVSTYSARSLAYVRSVYNTNYEWRRVHRRSRVQKWCFKLTPMAPLLLYVHYYCTDTS